MIDAVTGATTTNSASSAMKESIGMDKDAFLSLLVTQLQNQDPLNPMNGTEYISQLVQFTQVEQAYNTNTNLKKIIDMLDDSSALSTVSYIGKEVTAIGSGINLTSGSEANLSYVVPEAAQQLVVEITDSNGTIVRTLTKGETPEGNASLLWDGKDDAGAVLPSGTYNFSVKGVDSSGGVFACDTRTRGKVQGVSFSGTSPVLQVGGVEIPFSNILSVSGGS